MTITKNVDHNTLRITLEGRLDTNTAPQLEAELKSSTGGISELIFDFPVWTTSHLPVCGYCLPHRRS